ncbi:MAG: hypothetical protein J6W70_03180, partial [Lentisphaeria bacterium]|nr:hypothetical protein [Lentisphaeria bacterium]
MGYAKYALPPEELAGEAWEMPHLPARFQFVILRNWNRVPVGRIAAVLATTAERIIREAERMGLRPYDAELCRRWEMYGYL